MATQTQNPAYRPAPPRIWAIGDTHLPGGRDKTMDRFGDHWIGHAQKLKARIEAVVAPEDVLLLAGDLSWATKRREAQDDLAFLAALPGRKIAVKGNHDFWWDSDRPIAYPGLESLPVRIGSIGFAGSRGWQPPVAGADSEAMDRRTFDRERGRLEKSLAALGDASVRIALLHYPPHPFLDLLTAAGVQTVIYGHIHRGSPPRDEVLALDGETLDGIVCHCVACDRLDFHPRRIG